MKKITNIYQALSRAFVFTTLALVSVACTDVEPLKIKESSIETQNSELYQTYLTDLRAYKASEHKVAIGFMDNSRTLSQSQAQRIGAVPDSLDYLVLSTPANIQEIDAREIAQNRELKGIKTLYMIDFDAIKAVYDERAKDFALEPENAGKVFTPTFNNFLVDSIASTIDLCAKYGYDGIVMAFEGKSKLHMTDAERNVYTAHENIFIGIAQDWATRNPGKELLVKGRPQNILNLDFLERAKHILIDCRAYTSKEQAIHNVLLANGEGLNNNKFIPLVSTKSLDETDKKTGYWGSKEALAEIAKWIMQDSNDYSFSGLAIYDISNDYYQPAFTYAKVREAISIINPSVKK